MIGKIFGILFLYHIFLHFLYHIILFFSLIFSLSLTYVSQDEQMRRLLSLISSLPEMNYQTNQTNEKEEE